MDTIPVTYVLTGRPVPPPPPPPEPIRGVHIDVIHTEQGWQAMYDGLYGPFAVSPGEAVHAWMETHRWEGVVEYGS